MVQAAIRFKNILSKKWDDSDYYDYRHLQKDSLFTLSELKVRIKNINDIYSPTI